MGCGRSGLFEETQASGETWPPGAWWGGQAIHRAPAGHSRPSRSTLGAVGEAGCSAQAQLPSVAELRRAICGENCPGVLGKRGAATPSWLCGWSAPPGWSHDRANGQGPSVARPKAGHRWSEQSLSSCPLELDLPGSPTLAPDLAAKRSPGRPLGSLPLLLVPQRPGS